MEKFPFAGAVLFSLVTLVAPMQAAAASEAETQAAIHEVMSHDGLEKVNSKDVDLAYMRPGASLAAYSKVMLGPVDVAFSKNWDPKRPGSNLKISNKEREKIRSGTAKLVWDEFVKTLGAKGGYPIVEVAGPDVLKLKVSIINLYVTAPDVPTADRIRTYVSSAGEMTLVLEVLDSETGQVLSRVVDRQEADSLGGRMTWSNGVTNAAEAKIIASGWASKLRKALDKAQGIAK